MIWIMLAGVFLLAGCRSSSLTSSWKSKDPRGKNFRKILVLGLIHDNDRQLQENMEKHLAGDLTSLGYTVITSLEEFGPKAFWGLSEKDALAKLKSSEVDAVMTIVLLNKKMEKGFLPNRQNSRPSGYFQNLFWEYLDNTSQRVFEPGYYFENTEYFWESNFYELGNRSLVYSARTTSFNPANTEKLAHQYGKIIARNMIRKNIVKKDLGPVKKGF